MSRAVESVGKEELTRDRVAALFRKTPPPPPRDPSYSFDKKSPDQYPSKTAYNYERGSNLTTELSKQSRAIGFHPGEGAKASPTWYFKKTTAKGEIDNSGMAGSSYLDKYGSVRK